jgi:hypothetical protein
MLTGFSNLVTNNSAITTRPSEKWAGTKPTDLGFWRYYEYYHGWPNVKNGINSLHRRFMGSGIEVTSDDEQFTDLLNTWIAETNFIQKLKLFSLDSLITGNGFFEKIYDDKNLVNIKHVPAWTFNRVFRDDVTGKVLHYEQLVEGRLQNLSPDSLTVYKINNPENDGFGKSEFYSIATPRRIAGKSDEHGNPVNEDRYVQSLLDSEAELMAAHVESAKKHAKQLSFVTAIDANKDDAEKIHNFVNSSESDKWAYVGSTKFEIASPQLNTTDNSIDKYIEEIRKERDSGIGFPSKIFHEGGDMGFASGLITDQQVVHRINDMQSDLSELIADDMFATLASNWGFKYSKTNPKLVFKQYIEKPTFDHVLQLLNSEVLSNDEKRSLLRPFIPDLNDGEFDSKLQKKEKRKENVSKD